MHTWKYVCSVLVLCYFWDSGFLHEISKSIYKEITSFTSLFIFGGEQIDVFLECGREKLTIKCENHQRVWLNYNCNIGIILLISYLQEYEPHCSFSSSVAFLVFTTTLRGSISVSTFLLVTTFAVTFVHYITVLLFDLCWSTFRNGMI